MPVVDSLTHDRAFWPERISRLRYTWTDPVAADGLYVKLADIHGIDSFQALILAQKLLRQLINGAIEDGGAFLSVEDDSAIDVSTLFASDA